MSHRGSTLIELVVALAIMGVILALVELAPGRVATKPDAAAISPAALRRQSLITGKRVSIHDTNNVAAWTATGYPDGRVLVDSSVRHAPR